MEAISIVIIIISICGIFTLVLYKKYKIKLNKQIPFKCPYQKFECSEYDSGSATLLTSCKDCKNYNKGITVSKF